MGTIPRLGHVYTGIYETHVTARCFERDVRPKAFASLDALGPCMIKLSLASISAVLEPSTTASATAKFAGFLSTPAFRAGVPSCYRRRRYSCGHAAHTRNIANTRRYMQPSLRWLVRMLARLISQHHNCIQERDNYHNWSRKRVISTTYWSRPACPRPMCDQTWYHQHFRSFWTKHRHEHNSCVYRISLQCRTWGIRDWPSMSPVRQEEAPWCLIALIWAQVNYIATKSSYPVHHDL